MRQIKFRPLTVILTFALLIRIFIALKFQNVVARDEVFQFLEQAHRLVFGKGIVPWEFQVGLRCWLIPLLLAMPMALAHLVDPAPLAGLIFIRILLCIASLSIVWCAVKWGERFYGVKGAWIAGLFTALWPDLWLMAPHPLEEVLAADILVPAVYLISAADNLKRVAWAGFLLGVAFILRMQLAPSIAIAGIFLCARSPRRWRVALLAAALPVLAAGMLDWFTWGQPFRSFWLNIYLNVFLHVAKNEFGPSPLSYFIYMPLLAWLWTLPFILFLAWQGARRMPLPGIMAIAIIITHSLISHKEYRFMFPAIALVVPLAGIGLAKLAADLQKSGLLNSRWISLGVLLLAGPIFSPWIYFILGLQTSSMRIFENLAARHPVLVSVPGWDENSFLPMDIVLPASAGLTGQIVTRTPAGDIEADAVVAKEFTPVPAEFRLDACNQGNWIPFAGIPSARLCYWTRTVSAPAGDAPPFALEFPAAAKPFIIPDRLTDR